MCEQNIVKTQNCEKSYFDLIVEIPVVQYSIFDLRPKGSDLRDGRVY